MRDIMITSSPEAMDIQGFKRKISYLKGRNTILKATVANLEFELEENERYRL